MGWLIRTEEHDRAALVSTFNKNHFGVQIVSHRNGKEEKQERTSQPDRLLKRRVMAASLLAHPTHSPSQRCDYGDRKPEKIEELLHCFKLSPTGGYSQPLLQVIESGKGMKTLAPLSQPSLLFA
jgi:hypothetical protein